jgi:hypothetical protein
LDDKRIQTCLMDKRTCRFLLSKFVGFRRSSSTTLLLSVLAIHLLIAVPMISFNSFS